MAECVCASERKGEGEREGGEMEGGSYRERQEGRENVRARARERESRSESSGVYGCVKRGGI